MPRVRQHQANLFALLAVLFQNAAHEQRFGQQLAVGVRGKVDVFDAVFLCAIAVLRGKQGFVQRFARAHGHARFHHDLVQHFTGDFAAIARARRFGHRERRWRQNMQGDFREQTLLHQPFQAA